MDVRLERLGGECPSIASQLLDWSGICGVGPILTCFREMSFS